MSWQEGWEKFMVPNYGTPRICVDQTRGVTVTSSDGQTFVDLFAGVAVNALGHRHPAVEAAVLEQMGKAWHVSNLYAHPAGLALARRLHQLTGRRSLFVNSGTEANEAALKLVRKAANAQGRRDAVILSFKGSFHGRTMGPLSLGGQPHHQAGFEPLLPGIVQVPWNDPAALVEAFVQFDVAGVFFEPIQGEGGVRPMNLETAQTLHHEVSTHDTILVADEVQTGIGRTGHFWGHEHLGLEPHIITSAKGLGGGWPIGVCLVPDHLADHFSPGSHGSTFGGHPVAAAAAEATLATIEDQDLVERAAMLGQLVKKTAGEQGVVVQGEGLLLGFPVPDGTAGHIQQAMQDAGYLIGTAGSDVVRMAPPLIIEEDTLRAATLTLAGVIHALTAPIVN
jgi:acetylornithine/N-succinyldiaminopimelate aminotransferase